MSSSRICWLEKKSNYLLRADMPMPSYGFQANVFVGIHFSCVGEGLLFVF